ncbi:MAG: hypothetical protein ACOCX1_01480 [Fimbriimonadaceae bacterium]
MKPLAWLCGLTVVGCTLAGCGADEPNVGSAVPTLDLVEPFYGPEQADLVLGGQKMPVAVELEQDNQQVVLSALLDGVVLERERYLLTDEALYFVGFEDDEFDPPIRLLTLPEMVEPSEWEWQGDYLTGDFETPASAEVSAEAGSRMIAGQIHNRAVTVRISLNILRSESGSQRLLDFVFVPEQGVIERNLNDSSIRTLREEAESS